MRLHHVKETNKKRTPRLKIMKAVNGIFKVQILNAFLKNKQNRLEFQCDCRAEHEREWKSTHFASHILRNDGRFCVRMPLHLFAYRAVLRLRARLIGEDEMMAAMEAGTLFEAFSDKRHLDPTAAPAHLAKRGWLAFSREYRVRIASSMVRTEFDVGDRVRYKAEGQYLLSFACAKVLEKLPHGFLKLSTRSSAAGFKSEPFVLHESRVAVPENVSAHNLLDFSNWHLEVDQTVLLRLSG